MKKIVLALILLSSVVAYAGDPYVKTFYRNKNWTVLQVGITGEFKQCAIRSAPHYLDTGKNPKYGTTYLDISYPSNNVTFDGENIGAYFKIAKRATLQVDDGTSITITPEVPVCHRHMVGGAYVTGKDVIDGVCLPGKSIVDKMLYSKAKVVKISIDFGDGGTSIHSFSLNGFKDAYQKLKSCAR
jgi:hypothetical protein